MYVVKFIKNHYFWFTTQTCECTREQMVTVPRMGPPVGHMGPDAAGHVSKLNFKFPK